MPCSSSCFATACSLRSARWKRDEGEEEERRLFYVAITRARNELYLSYPLIRAGFGSSGDMMQQPSRFLEEIPGDLVEEWKLETGSGRDGVAPSSGHSLLAFFNPSARNCATSLNLAAFAGLMSIRV